VGKSFRPPEIHQKQPYYGTKVDAWCLGWSTFYLLAAQPLFLSANPSEQDPDWELFEKAEFATLFRQKATSCSQQCIDFILKLLEIDPKRRMSVREALQHEWLRDCNSRPMFAPKELLPDTPDKRAAESEYVPGRVLGVTPTKEAGHSSPTVGGNLNGNYDEVRAQGVSTTAPNYSSGAYRGGGLTGSLGGASSGGLSGVATAGGLHGGIYASEWQNNRHRSGQSGVAPTWKMTPSRSESPGPGTMMQGYYQAGGSAGTPTPNQYAPLQARTSSPFGPVPRNSGFVPLQRRSPSPPPRPNASLVRNTTGTNVYGGTRDPATSWPDLGNQSGTSAASQNSHTPRPARISGVSSNAPGGRGDPAEYAPSLSVPLQTGSTREGREQNLDAAQSQAQVDGDVRFGQMGGSGRHASAAVGGSNALRAHSPMSQQGLPQNMLLRQQNGRGLSPSPIRSGTGIDAAWNVPSPLQRSGSPMGQHHQPATLGSEAARGNLAGSASQFWQSPRAASPSSNMAFRAPEVYSRGRSHTRALSPSQQFMGGLGSNTAPTAQAIAGGMVRTLSPTGGMPTRTAGIAWSPVPPSPPAPKRSISPQPSLVNGIGANNNSVSSLRWMP
jgi:serine/threonine protein kinase